MKTCGKCKYWVITECLKGIAAEKKIKAENLGIRYCLLITDFRKGYLNCRFTFKQAAAPNPPLINENLMCKLFILNYNKQMKWQIATQKDVQHE